MKYAKKVYHIYIPTEKMLEKMKESLMVESKTLGLNWLHRNVQEEDDLDIFKKNMSEQSSNYETP